MPMSDYPFVNQLHADRTARLVSEQRMLRLPSFPRSLFTKKERRVAAARVAHSC